MTEKKRIARVKEWVKLHKALVILIAAVLLLVFLVFGAKIKIYFNFLLGKDIIVKLDIEKTEFYLMHGEEQNVMLEAKVTTNPFCTAVCNSSFIDISKGSVIEQGMFAIRTGSPFKKEYTIKPPAKGTGLYLYRFDMECKSIRTLLCDTREEPSTRSILVSVSYNLTEEEKILKEKLKERLENLTEQLGILEGKQIALESAAIELNKTLEFDDRTYEAGKRITLIHNRIKELEELWQQEDYYLLTNKTEKAIVEFKNIEKLIEDADKSLSDTADSYNKLIAKLNSIKESLDEFRESTLMNTTQESGINSAVDAFNNAIRVFKKKTTLSEKENLLANLAETINLIVFSIKDEIKKEALAHELEIDINYDILCRIDSNCIQHPSIAERANQSEFNLGATCSRIEGLRQFIDRLNNSLADSYTSQNYPDTDEFWSSIRTRISSIKHNITAEYLGQLPENKSNTNTIKEILILHPYSETKEYAEYNLTPAFIAELARQIPSACNYPNTTIAPAAEISFNQVVINRSIEIQQNITFEEPMPECCVFGKCEDCCIAEECRNDSSTFPVVFLHGHAVDKELSAEYSLEGFNKLQKKMEEDGYLNAGTVTLYSARDAPKGIWGLPKAPLTIRTSYYFDIFKEPENYIVVQTKSENIDTYAIRLKELVDIIRYKTGKPKINIVAFSMGGLVARRYIQIFGRESVDKLILIGTPNLGIAGDTADYCPITGERRECEDMNSESLFINKLNRGPAHDIPIYNIIGDGCAMSGGIGDGVVLKEKAWLEGADNFVINGACPGRVIPLHLKLRDIDAYPEVYKVIKEALSTGH